MFDQDFEDQPTRGKPKRPLPEGIGAILVFLSGEDRGREYPILFTRTVIGRKFGDLLIRDIQASSSHAALEFRNDHFYVVDLGSTNGTYVARKKIQQKLLTEGDQIQIGETLLELQFDVDRAKRLSLNQPRNAILTEGGLTELIEKEFIHAPREGSEQTQRRNANTDSAPVKKGTQIEPELTILKGADVGKKYRFKKPKVSIGRIEADFIIRDQDVSRKHAMLEMEDNGQFLLRDLASTNGTFVNGEQIKNKLLEDGDTIRMGHTEIRFNRRTM